MQECLMETLLLSSSRCQKAANIIKKGGIVAMPTETVYGLAADVFNEEAVKKIFLAKGRPSDNPLIVHIADLEDIHMLVADFPDIAQKLAEKFWPGPLTMVLPKSPNVPDSVTAGLESVAVRFPSHPVAREIIKKSKCPLVAPSANISGKPSPTSFEHVVNDLSHKIDAIVDGGDCSIGVESTVVSLLGEVPRILRPGVITASDIEKVTGKVEIDENVCEQSKKKRKILSPGMKYKHYSPSAQVYMVIGSPENYCEYTNTHASEDSLALCFEEDIPFLNVPYISYGSMENKSEQARRLFSALRQTESMDVKCVYAHFNGKIKENLAIYNRLVRAAGFRVISV